MNNSSLVKLFALQLGWNSLNEHQFRLSPEDVVGLTAPVLVTCWSGPDKKLFIQINQREHGVYGKYQVTVAPWQYRISNVGFMSADFTDEAQAIAEAARLATKLHRKNYRNPTWRKDFILKNPTRIFITKKRRGWLGRVAKTKRLELQRTGKNPLSDYPVTW